MYILYQRFPHRVVEDILDSADAKLGPLRKVAAQADNYDRAQLQQSNLDTGTLILDSNGQSAMEDLLRGYNKKGQPVNVFADLDPNYQDAINAVRASRGLGAYVDVPSGHPSVEDIVGPGADLRATPVSATEVLTGHLLSNRTSHLTPHLSGITPNRSHTDYSLVIDDMEAVKVGGEKGALDRAVVADAMFAKANPGIVPVLVTTDQKIVVPLARYFVVAPRPFPTITRDIWKNFTKHYHEGRITIEIRGHRLDIVFKG